MLHLNLNSSYKCFEQTLIQIRNTVQPTSLRKSEDYVIYYHTWTWTILTGRILIIDYITSFTSELENWVMECLDFLPSPTQTNS